MSVNIVKDDSDSDSDSDSDDCVILDGNPDKMVPVNVRACDDSDTLQIVGEKGEIACRDFPHSRHLCFSFSFTSTAHQVHCHQCHCYVCDSPAPCAQWGTGISVLDHCHASDKNECWRTQRDCRKMQDKPVPVILPVTDDLPKALAETPSSIILPTSMPLLVSEKNQSGTHLLKQGRALLVQARQQASLVSLPKHTNLTSPNKGLNAGNRSVGSCTLPAVSKKYVAAASVVSPKRFNPTVSPPSSKPQREEIDEICEHCIRSSRSGQGVSLFLVHWRGRPSSDTSWISAEELRRLAPDLWQRYQVFIAAGGEFRPIRRQDFSSKRRRCRGPGARLQDAAF